MILQRQAQRLHPYSIECTSVLALPNAREAGQQYSETLVGTGVERFKGIDAVRNTFFLRNDVGMLILEKFGYVFLMHHQAVHCSDCTNQQCKIVQFCVLHLMRKRKQSFLRIAIGAAVQRGCSVGKAQQLRIELFAALIYPSKPLHTF